MKKQDNQDWQNDMGLTSIKEVDRSQVNDILKMNLRDLHDKDARELQYYLLALSSYKMFLVSQIGELQSKINWYERKVEVLISSAAARANAPSKEERRAIAIENNEKVAEYYDDLEDLRLKYDQIKGIPDALQEFINKIDRAEYRKSQDLERK